MNPFDESKYYLGTLCKRGHDYEGTGKSLRWIRKHECLKCKRIMNKKSLERNKVKLRCENCQRFFLRPKVKYAKNIHKNQKIFCSQKCNGEFRKTKIKVECKNCKKLFEKHKCEIGIRRNNFCSQKCHYEWRKGKNCYTHMLSEENVKNEIEKMGHKFIGPYVNYETKILVICKCGEKWDAYLSVIRRGGTCKICSSKRQGEKMQTGKEVPCVVCGKTKYITPCQEKRNKNFCCSAKCNGRYQANGGSGNWKGGISKESTYKKNYLRKIKEDEILMYYILCKEELNGNTSTTNQS